LLHLPDTCLFEVLRWHAQDPRSLFSAARTHSRLRQAAAAVLTKCTISSKSYKQTHPKVNSLLLYLSRHGQHVTSLDVRHPSGRKRVCLPDLPPGLQLDSLCLEYMSVQLCPGNNRRGVLEALPTLTQLQLLECCLTDGGSTRLEGALQQLPNLEHLNVLCMRRKTGDENRKQLFVINSEVLQQLQGLTYLELEHCDLNLPTPGPMLQLSNLQSLRLCDFNPSFSSTAGLLASVQHLTMLELQPSHKKGDPYPPLPPGVITGRLQLQHLHLSHYTPAGDAAAVGDFLYDLEQLTELTHLRLNGTLNAAALPAAAAYAALTASSKLQQLHVPGCNLPPFAWQHVLPFSRQLPNLQALQLSDCTAMGVFDMASLVSCCSSVQKLELPPLNGDSGTVLAPLSRMTGLQRLVVPGQSMNDAGVKQLARLTGLEELSLACPRPGNVTDAGLLPLTALRQLHSLHVTVVRFEQLQLGQQNMSSSFTQWFRTSVSPGSMPKCLPRSCLWSAGRGTARQFRQQGADYLCHACLY
jgi:hypothetical protein